MKPTTILSNQIVTNFLFLTSPELTCCLSIPLSLCIFSSQKQHSYLLFQQSQHNASAPKIKDKSLGDTKVVMER